MDLDGIAFTVPQLEILAKNFLVPGKASSSVSDIYGRAVSEFLEYIKAESRLSEIEEGRTSTLAQQTTIAPVVKTQASNTAAGVTAPSIKPKSIGNSLSIPTRATLLESAKIVPFDSSPSTALSFLDSPEAVVYKENYNRDVEYENETILQMDNISQGYDEKEEEIIAAGIGIIEGLKMKGAIPFQSFSTTFSSTRFLKGFYNSNEGDIYNKTIFTVNGSHSRVAARVAHYFYECKNPAFIRSKAASLADQVYLEVPNSHSKIYCQAYIFPSPMANREMIERIVWKRLNEKSVIVAYHPLASHPKVVDKDGNEVIRGSVHSVYLVTQLDENTTEVQWSMHMNFGGYMPRAIIRNKFMPNTNRILSHHQAFFICAQKLKDFRKSDGKLLGELLVNQIKTARKRGGWKKRAVLGKVGVDEFLYCSVAMRELLPKHLWFRALLHVVSLNQVRVAPTGTTALSDLKDQDAANLAKGLSTIVLTNTEPESAVDHWIAQNAALEEFEKIHPWIRPFFTELAQYNLSTNNLGLRLRVFSGALLSTFDLITDVYMTIQFYNTDGQQSYGKINSWLIGLTMLMQIIISYAQNSGKSSLLLQDVICILTGFKPALDAYRVGSGAEREDHQKFTPLTEMTWCKCIEVVFEAVPSSILQMFALILASEKNTGAIFSILVSAATIGFSSAMITYDWDTSPTQRNNSSFFYGFVPDKGRARAICFVSMMSFSSVHVLLQSFSCALLLIMNKTWFYYYVGADIGLFFLFKIVTRDFFYYLNVSGILRIISSVIARLAVKVMLSFTLLIQTRSGCEAGGVSFLFTVLLSVVAR
ncbi:hypothetical protein TL16_g09612 [Triparma laevis f. inornata]|uniref:START domain-containing protein n=1 Tax=Triparma laevis f. inornata TaxID=1714386 RepID=A0A9W7B3U0_9STRA|nr:hypothetical protein TL16_g09612 [Triparma laevis f. inornata]